MGNVVSRAGGSVAETGVAQDCIYSRARITVTVAAYGGGGGMDSIGTAAAAEAATIYGIVAINSIPRGA